MHLFAFEALFVVHVVCTHVILYVVGMLVAQLFFVTLACLFSRIFLVTVRTDELILFDVHDLIL